MEEIYKCPKCGEKENLHLNYDWSKQHRPVESVLCNECGEIFDGNIPISQIKDSYKPYCPICEGCGEEGCCSPMMCKQDPNGSYCQSYLNDLKFGYKMYNQIMEMLEEEQEKNKEILEKIQKIFDDTYDKIYK